MMGQLPALETRKAIDKPDQHLTIKGADQHPTGFSCRGQVRKRYHIEIRNTPDLLLQLFDSAHSRDFVNLTYLYSGNFRPGSHAHFTSTGSAMYDACWPERNTF